MDVFFDLFISLFTYQIDMPFVYECLGPLGIAALIGGSFGFGGSIASGMMATADSERAREFAREERIRSQKWQEEMMDKQNQMQKDTAQWSYDNFDSPLAQKQNMQAAGMNPFVEGSALESGASSAPQGPSMPSSAMGPNIQPSSQKYVAIQLAADSVGKALKDYKQFQLQDQEIEQKRLQNEGIMLDNIAKSNNNSIFDLVVQARQEGLINSRLSNQLLGVKAKYAEGLAKTDFAAKQQTVDNLKAEFDLILSNVKKNSYEFRYISAMRDRILSQIQVDKSQVSLNDANAGKAIAETETEDTLRNHKVMEYVDKHVRSLAEIRNMKREQARKSIDQIMEFAGFKKTGSINPYDTFMNFWKFARNTYDSEQLDKIRELGKVAYDIDKSLD